MTATAEPRTSIEAEVGMPYTGDRDHIGEFSVMLDHAARRVSISHSWIRRAEAERQRFEADAQRIATAPPEAMLATIWPVTSLGYAETPCAVMP